MVNIDPSRTLGDLANANKQIRFGVARGLTQIAKAGAAAEKAVMPARIDRPRPFTLAGLAIQPATRDNLQSVVFIKDVQAGYLLLEETGGERTPQRGSPINLPVQQRTNAYGNIPRGTIGRLRQRADVFVADGKGNTSHLARGLYQRLGVRTKKGFGSQRGRRKSTGRGKQGSRLKLLVAFEKVAQYRPRLGFRETVIAEVSRTGLDTMAKSVADALRTAKR